MRDEASRRFLLGVLVITLLSVAACNRNSGPDPAAANLAPADQYAAAPPEEGNQGNYGEPVAQAPQPPPPLPEYTQPDCPGDNYMWTPGYWGYAETGYYWVPGAWVMAPYVDALWTPPYWDYYGGRYRWHAGYWGRHIGYYGGINYGFGYTGLGFYGGYWDTGGQFVYNRSVTRINTTVVNHYYSHSVTNYTPFNRVSYNGPGGIARQPVPGELAVRRESRISPLPVQVEHMRNAAVDRAQFAETNRGRPATAAMQHPLPALYAAPAPRGEAQHGEARPGMPMGNGRPEAAPTNREPFNRVQPEMPRGEVRGAPQAPPVMARPQMPEPRPGNPGVREMPQQRPEPRAAEPARPPEVRGSEGRGGAERRMEQNPAPAQQPQAAPHPAPQQNQARPAPQQPQPHAAPQPNRPQQNPGKEEHGRRGDQ